MLSAISNGQCLISNFATSVDCLSTIKCFRQLGVLIDQDGNRLKVDGVGKRGLRHASGPLDCGNSGTTMRLISGILAGQQFESTLIGDESLSKRPMRRIIEPLTEMGAHIESSDGNAPLRISGGRLKPIRYEMPVASAQVKSSVLLAGLFADGSTQVIEASPTRDHTERMLRGFGVDVTTETIADGLTEISLSGDAELSARHIQVPGDISSAAFFIVAAACLPGSELRIVNVGINPTRSAIIDTVREFGVSVELGNVREATGEPVADLVVRGGVTQNAEPNLLHGSVIPNLIDEIPILAVLGSQLPGGMEVRGASELRTKESDRITSIVTNLRLMGAHVEEFEDGFKVARSDLQGARVSSFGDHRIAMAFAVAGLLATGETEIGDPDCVEISFPNFFSALAEVVEQ